MTVNSSLSFRSENKYFASTDGSFIQQLLVQSAPSFSATAVDFATRKSKSRSYQVAPITAGYEQITRAGLLENAERIGAEAVEHLAAPSVDPGPKDLILLPSHLALTIHESIGHSTELDRALGYEANFAGTSFLAPPEKVLGKLRVGSSLVNFVGDRTLPQAMATCGYDDDGVKATSFDVIKEGVFVGYQTIRDQAHLVGEETSRGCSNADSFDSVPFQRMPNVWLKPGSDGKSLDDLIAGVEDGILIDGRGSYSIDQQRYNFQFGGDAFWEIKSGKKGRMLADVAYQSRTTDFWGACAAIADQRSWQNFGLTNDGKGQPQQTNAMSHGCAPTLFRRINVLRTE
jgi:TldD protein